MKKLYRIEWRVNYDDRIRLELVEFIVQRETPAGYWITVNYKPKWVSASATKRYAYQTIQAARYNFLRRNKTRLRILEHQLYVVKKSLELLENFYKPKEKNER